MNTQTQEKKCGGCASLRNISVTQNRHLDIKDLLHEQKQVVIKHDGQDYYLRITRNNKLILTK